MIIGSGNRDSIKVAVPLSTIEREGTCALSVDRGRKRKLQP